ncbi:hypothetical protein D7W79_18605 [Corallococcus exercitus]|uniref:Uncharacterized protein n=1 Tax=Corallococcus exercitus TaxID=2316736 RepID=A0A3A8HZ04_9BACT|nr:hypothetical protein [Corallococcus exercitus]NOK32783.1 hypothetical protein [Corallococcus exercitus]RKG76125.1 hypothetical protein D7W79_18605 [Corallococcus exercitus]
MSLQRHHYRYCGSAAAAALNSLLHAAVTDATVTAEALEVGDQIEKLLKAKGATYKVLFGKNLTTKSGRVYVVDNSALNPNGSPNHFFVTSGPSVSDRMSMDAFVSASALRRVEEAIADRRARGDKLNYLDAKALIELRGSTGGQTNPVILAYIAARTALMASGPKWDTKLGEVSGRADLVTLTRKFP